ncbi:putative ribonuclease H-like domain-containing protein [Tanacetum coccineum]
MYYDSKSAITISCNPVQHSHTKHIVVRYHFIKEHVERGIVELYIVRTEYQLVVMFTKALLKERFEYLVGRLVSILSTAKPRLSTVKPRVNTAQVTTVSTDQLVLLELFEQEVKGTANSTQLNSQKIWLFETSPSSTNEVNTAYGVSTANTQVSPTSTQVSTASTQICKSLQTCALMDFQTLRGLASVEEQLVFYKKNEVIFCEQLAVLKRDISYKDSEISTLKSYGPKTSKSVSEKISKEVRESPDTLLVEKFISDDKLEKKTGSPTKIEFVRPKQQEKPVRKLVKYAEMYRSQSPGGNQRNWNNQKLAAITIKGKGWNMVPRAILMKTDLRSLNTARPVNTAHPKTTVYSARLMSRFSESAQPTVKRHYQTRTALTNKNFSQKVNTSKGKFYTARPKAVNTARPNSAVVNVVRADQGPPQKEDQANVDSGCSRHMTENMSYLSDFKEFDGGYVTFGGGAKGGKITGKGTLKTGKLDFEDVYFVKELQFNLFSVSHMCDKKNRVFLLTLDVLFLSPDFKCILMKVRFTWVFFLATKDETSGILKSFITEIENLVYKKVQIIICDNGTEFKNKVMSEFCEQKGIKREFSVAKTPQQNGVAERRNRTLIEAARTIGRTPALSFMRPFGCHVIILNTLDYLGKFDGKSDEGFFVGYSLNSKAFRVYNIRIRKVEENLHIRFLEDKPIIVGDGPKWLFDIDVLTISMNYVPFVAGTNSNDLVDGSLFDSSLKNASNDEPQPSSDAGKNDDEGLNKESIIDDQERPENSTQDVDTVGPSTNTTSTNVNVGSLNINIVSLTVTSAPLEASHADFFGDETKVDMSNITTTYPVPFTLNTRIHKDNSLDHVIGDVQSGVQTRRMTRTINEQGFISVVNKGKTHEDLHTCLFACFLSQVEPKKVTQALTDPSWMLAMQNELLQFKLQKMVVKSAFLYGKIEEEFMSVNLQGLQVTQKDDGIFISQDKYVDEILKKFGFSTVKTASTPMKTLKPLLKDAKAEDVDVYLYRSMIPSLMYLTPSRHDIIYLKGQPKLGLRYLKDSPFDLEAYSDSDYASASLDRKSTIEAEYVAAANCCGQFWETATAKTLDNGEIELTAIIDGKLKIVTKASVRRHLQLADSDGISSLPTTKIFEQLSLMGVNIPLFPAMIVQGPVVQGEGSTHPVESHHTPTSAPSTSQLLISPSSRRTNRQESVVPQPRSPTQTLVADEAASTGVDVIYGGDTTTVTGLEGRKIAEIDQDPAISLVQHDVEIQGRHEHDMEFDLDTAKDISTAKPVSTAGAAVTTASIAVVSTANPTRRVSTADGITMAETLVYIRKSAAKDKGKGKMDEYEPVQTKTKLQQEQERLGYEAAVRLQAELEEEENQRITRVHEAASSFNVEEWKDIQARVEADEELTQMLQAKEREMYTEAEQARMLVELINKRKIYFAAQRAEERRNKPPTQAQQRTYMSNYIKNMRGYTLQQLRGYSFDEIKNLFKTKIRRVHTFVPIESEIERVIPELPAGSSKRDAEEELDQESYKRQKIGESSELAEEPRDKEADELSQEELQ